jgi:CelD/BcsL family acetyltransferase involved in cellulose biosynthesis
VLKAGLRAEIVRPSQLGAVELAAWRDMQARTPSLQRAFLTPTFALACEQAYGRAFVAVLHSGGSIQGFLPFQFKSEWHRRIGLAERIGGEMSDNAGIVGQAGLRLDGSTLLRMCRLASLSLSHLSYGQDDFGLDADWSDVSYITDLRNGPEAYFAALLARNADFVRDTKRRQRKASKLYGDISLRDVSPVSATELATVMEEKRRQYLRTQAPAAYQQDNQLALLEALNGAPGPECRLVLSMLECGERTLARHLGLRYHDTLSWWFPVYDPAAESVSPGRLILWEIIRNAGTAGIGLVDYGAGDAQYKRQFSTDTLRVGRAFWSARDARSWLARAWQSAEWRYRSWRHERRKLLPHRQVS